MQLPLFRKPVYNKFNIFIGVLALIISGLIYAGIFTFNMLVFVPVIWLIFLSWGAYTINSGVFISTINNLNTAEKVVALTFDDGPHENTKAILELLEKYNAKASFFVTGINAEKFPELVLQQKNEGHQIGNHTYGHNGNFPFFRVQRMIEEIAKTSIIIKKIIGTQPKIFRPPFGITNPFVAKATRKLNLKIIGWSVRSLDTVTKDPKKVVLRIKKKIKPGSIVLLHDYPSHSIQILEQILKYLSEQKYKCVTINGLMSKQL